MYVKEHKTRTGRPVFLAIDEAQSCPKDSAFWNTVLKRNNDFLVPIITGLPVQFDSPQIAYKEGPLFIHFDDNEILGEITDVLLNFISEKHPSAVVDRNMFSEFLINLKNYIGGQAYPFMKLCHYFCENHISDVQQGFQAVDAYLRDSKFLESVPMQTILSRCFSYSSPLSSAFQNFFYNPQNLSSEEKLLLFKSGYVNEGEITSPLFLQLALADPTIILKNKSFAVDNIEDVILYAFEKFDPNVFIDPIRNGPSYERSIGTFFAAIISELPGLYLRPEMQFQRSGNTIIRGPVPCVDFYINSKFDICIELLRNENKLESHIDRFQLSTGSYKQFKDKFVLVNICLDNSHPILSTLPKHYASLIDKIYTFDFKTNSLYRGDKIIRHDVCKRIPSMGKTLRNIITGDDNN